MMSSQESAPEISRNRDGERGSALFLALMVSLVLLFLGMGVLMQTSLGLQASGTDRWIVKSMYAADAGVMAQIQLIQNGAIGPPGSFILQDDPALEGFLKGEYIVSVSQFCETRPSSPVVVAGVAWSYPEYQVRHFHVRSDSERTIGGLGGLSRAAISADVSSFPFLEERFVEVSQCR